MPPKENPTTALAKIEDRFPILAADFEDFLETFQENLGGQPVSPWDLTRVTIPAGGSTFFSVADVEHPDGRPESKLEGIILAHNLTRQYFSTRIGQGEGGPPDCFAPDGRFGYGTPGGDCSTCPNAEYGTAIKDDGSVGRGHACQQRHEIFLLTPGEALPLRLSVAPSSLKTVKKYLFGLLSKSVKFWSVVSSFRLVAKKSKDNKPYSEIVVELSERVPDDLRERVRQFREALAPSLRVSARPDASSSSAEDKKPETF